MELSSEVKHIFRRVRRILISSLKHFFSTIRSPSWTLSCVCFFALFTSITPLTRAQSQPIDHNSSPEYLNMPWKFGEVIYRINPLSSRQLYIIAISHRDPNSRANASTTIQTQMEIFRIGEWLKKNVQLNLLLPEGYFGSGKTYSAKRPNSIQPLSPLLPIQLDNTVLQEKLAADTPFKNAEMLLMEYLRFHASQVEDKKIYDAVRSSLSKLQQSNPVQESKFTCNIEELNYLQEVRTAHLLQKIPSVIEDKYHSGVIGNRSAIFTIGLNHIKDIFRYIEEDSIRIASPPHSDVLPDILDSNLNLLETGYGVTIIIPRTLANNEKLLEMTSIDRILLAEGK